MQIPIHYPLLTECFVGWDGDGNFPTIGLALVLYDGIHGVIYENAHGDPDNRFPDGINEEIPFQDADTSFFSDDLLLMVIGAAALYRCIFYIEDFDVTDIEAKGVSRLQDIISEGISMSIDGSSESNKCPCEHQPYAMFMCQYLLRDAYDIPMERCCCRWWKRFREVVVTFDPFKAYCFQPFWSYIEDITYYEDEDVKLTRSQLEDHGAKAYKWLHEFTYSKFAYQALQGVRQRIAARRILRFMKRKLNGSTMHKFMWSPNDGAIHRDLKRLSV